MYFCGVGCEYTKWEVCVWAGAGGIWECCVSQALWYEPETALKHVYLKDKVDPADKIQSNRTVPGFKISILYDETTASLQWQLKLQDFSIQSAKTNLWWVVGFLPVWFIIHRTWTTGIWVASCARWALFLICEDWDHVSKEELYKLSNTNINCSWIIYKCNAGIFQMCESWL